MEKGKEMLLCGVFLFALGSSHYVGCSRGTNGSRVREEVDERTVVLPQLFQSASHLVVSLPVRLLPYPPMKKQIGQYRLQ